MPFFSELLRAHAIIEERLQRLERAAGALRDPSGANPLAEISATLDFFEKFGAQHQHDEERTLFPRLRPLPAFAQMLDAFDFQHRMADTEQAAFGACVRGFDGGPTAQLERMAHRFAEVQRAHMLAEERALFPLAEQSLPRKVIAEMSRELRVPNG